MAMPRRPKVPPKRGGFIQTTVEVEGRSETRIVEMPLFEPEPWGEMAPLGIVGQRVPRMDAEEKVTGRARYTADIARPGIAARGHPAVDHRAGNDPHV